MGDDLRLQEKVFPYWPEESEVELDEFNLSRVSSEKLENDSVITREISITHKMVPFPPSPTYIISLERPVESNMCNTKDGLTRDFPRAPKALEKSLI